MSKKLLITGASGFLGYHLVEEAVKQGFEVTAAVRRHSPVEQLKNFPIEFTSLDYEDPRALLKNLTENNYDYIVHAAGATKAHHTEDYDRVNALYTMNLAQAAVAYGQQLKKFVFISSLAAVGPLDNSFDTITEKKVSKPVTPYGKSKLLAEVNLASFNTLPLIILRPTAIYGPMERDLFLIIKAIYRGLELYIGDIDQMLSFVHVKDVAKVSLQALTSSTQKGVYNLSDGQRYDRYALTAVLKNLLHKKTIKIHLPLPVVKVMASVLEVIYSFSKKKPALNTDKLAELTARNWVCSIDSLQKDIGYVPRYTLQNGMKETLEWYKINKWL
ncbi:MAG: UDP-glucose 4-epimerase [Azospira oryzae]|jgi:nucleoside-diphosphate-sugar epimerase|nr:MAG: UDP-glucose 4-epimerase [Azospira oryzae]